MTSYLKIRLKAFVQTIHENPLLSGFLAVIVGPLIATLLWHLLSPQVERVLDWNKRDAEIHSDCADLDQLNAAGRTEGAAFHIVMTNLLNDPDGTQTRILAQSLERLYQQSPVSFALMECIVRDDGGNNDEIITRAEADAAVIAERTGADIVIWGESRKKDKELDLRLSHSFGTIKDEFSVDEYELSTDFGANIGALIAGKMVGLTSTAGANRGKYLVPLMERVSQMTGALIENPPKQLTDFQMAIVILAHARANFDIGRQSGRQDNLETAIAYFSKAFPLFEQSGDLVTLSETKAGLGEALSNLGDLRGDANLLQEATKSLRAALSAEYRTKDERDWALAQNSLGNALMNLDDIEPDVRLLYDAHGAYQAALEVFTQHRHPLDWAMVQHNTGNVELALWHRGEPIGLLRAAIKSTEAALTKRDAETMGPDRGLSLNNLGNALYELGQIEQSTEVLGKAVLVHIEALGLLRQDEFPLEWARTQSNLGNARLALARLTNDPNMATAAIEALVAAIELRTEAANPLGYAATQNNLGNARYFLAELQDSDTQFELALANFREAARVLRHFPASIDALRVDASLANVLQVHAKRKNSSALLLEARDARLGLQDRLDQLSNPIDGALNRSRLAEVEIALFNHTSDPAHLHNARAYLEAARKVYAERGQPFLQSGAAHRLASIAMLDRNR